jgi:putative DNA primase/helicase
MKDWLDSDSTAAELGLAPESKDGSQPLMNRLTDAGNAKRFAKEHGADVRYCHAWGSWFHWDRRRFVVDDVGNVVERAKQTIRKMFVEADKLPQSDRKALLQHAIKSEQANRIDAMLRLARSEPGIPVLPAELDAHPWLFNCSNGVVCLKTGKLLKHDRDYLLTKMTPVEYLTGGEGDCPAWEFALATILGCDDDLVRFVQRLFGMALVGEASESYLPIFCGGGSNGKTVTTETILDVFGEYGLKAPSDLLLAKGSSEHPTAIADLFGRRLVLAAESDEGRRLAEGTVKELTGGDTIRARKMRQDYWDFKPSHTIILITNHKPRVRGTDFAIWRRLALVPFSVTFWDADKGGSGLPELQADKGLKAKLQSELGGILRWCVDGCLEWQRSGLRLPESVTAATSSYKASEDVIAEFLNECLAFGETYSIKASTLRTRLDEWCKSNGERPINSRRLSDYLASIGIVKRKSSTVYYDGIAET